MSEVKKAIANNKMDIVVRELVKKSMPYKKVFASEDGKEVLKDLRHEFKSISVTAPTPHETVIRAAQYDVLDYIEKMITIKAGEENEIT